MKLMIVDLAALESVFKEQKKKGIYFNERSDRGGCTASITTWMNFDLTCVDGGVHTQTSRWTCPQPHLRRFCQEGPDVVVWQTG